MAFMGLNMRRRRARGRMLWRLAILIALSLVLWAGGLVWFASTIPNGVSDTKTKTDAIAVLTGGRGRLGVGFQLLSEKLAKKLFISGVYRGVDVNRLLELFQQKPEACGAASKSVIRPIIRPAMRSKRHRGSEKTVLKAFVSLHRAIICRARC